METDVDFDNASVTPFVCGLCNKGFQLVEAYYLHLKSHNTVFTKSFHICEDTTVPGGEDSPYRCKMCKCQFRSICTLHDHLTNCTEAGSYIYDNSRRIAYPLPLGSECSFYECRNDGVRDADMLHTYKEVNEDCDEDFGQNYATGFQDADKFWLNFCQGSVKKENNVDKTLCDVATNTNSDLKYTCEQVASSELGTVKRKRGRPKKDNEKINKTNGPTDNAKANTSCGDFQELTVNKRKEKITRSVKPASNHKSETIFSSNKSGKDKKKKKLSEVVNGIHVPANSSIAEDVEIKQEVEMIPENSLDILKTSMMDTDVTAIDLYTDLNNIDESIKAALGIAAGVAANNTTEETTSLGKNTNCENNDSLALNVEPIIKTQSDNIEIRKKDDTKNKKSVKIKGQKKLMKPNKKVFKSNKYFEIMNEPSRPKKKPGRKKLDNETCDVCGKSVRHSKMRIHAISHSDVRPYKCEHCPKTYKYPEHLAIHLKSHEDVLPFYCEVCGQGFIDVNRLKRHAMMHTDDRPYQCELCNAGFVTKYKLNRHMYAHTGIKSMQCDLCGMRFAHKESLSQHIAGIHKKERRFSCLECDKKFFTNYQLKCHAMKHSGLRPFKCNHCNADFIERKELRRHMRKQHKLSLDGKSINTDVTTNSQSLDEDCFTHYPTTDIADNDSSTLNQSDSVCLLTVNQDTSQKHIGNSDEYQNTNTALMYLARDEHCAKSCENNNKMETNFSNLKQYETPHTLPVKHLSYQHHSNPYSKDGQFNLCTEQKPAAFPLVNGNESHNRLYLPMAVFTGQEKQKGCSSVSDDQQNKDINMSDEVSQIKAGLYVAHTLSDQSKNESTNDKKFTVL